MKEISFTPRWSTAHLTSIFDENTHRNIDFTKDNALQFCFGSIVEKKKYDLIPKLIETYRKYTIVQPNDIMINGLKMSLEILSCLFLQKKNKTRLYDFCTGRFRKLTD